MSEKNWTPEEKPMTDLSRNPLSTRQIVDVPALIGLDWDDAAETLGDPTLSIDIVPGHGLGVRAIWSSPKVNALFAGGSIRRAEFGCTGVRYRPASARRFGVKGSPVKTDRAMRWTLPGFEFSLFPGKRRQAAYAYLSDMKPGMGPPVVFDDALALALEVGEDEPDEAARLLVARDESLRVARAMTVAQLERVLADELESSAGPTG